MNKYIRATSLQARLVWLVLLALVFMLLIATVYGLYITTVASKEAQVATQALCEQAAYTIGAKLQTARQAAYALGYTQHAQDYLTSADMSKRLSSNAALTTMAGYMMDAQPEVLDIALISLQGNMRRYGGAMTPQVWNEFTHDYPTLSTMNFETAFFTKFIDMPEQGGLYTLFATPLYSPREQNLRIGTCVVLIDGRSMRENLRVILPDQHATVSLLQGDTLVFSLTQPGSMGKQIIEQEIAAIGWTLRMQYAPGTHVNLYQQFYRLLIVLTAAMTALIALFAVALHWGFTRPIQRMVANLGAIANKQVDRMTLPRPSELRSIASSVNFMLKEHDRFADQRIKDQRKLFDEQLLSQSSQLSALQSQINPHFLYNTLECMRSLGMAHGISEVSSIAEAMTLILRYSIKSPKYVRITQELVIVESYLQIMSIRFDDRFTTTFHVQAEAEQAVIPCMILQSLIENAVFHGLEPKVGKGLLDITISIANDATNDTINDEDQILYISVKDNGVGMPPERLETIRLSLQTDPHEQLNQTNASIGLLNIQRRIQLSFGKQYGVTIDSPIEGGTCVVVCLPYRKVT